MLLTNSIRGIIIYIQQLKDMIKENDIIKAEEGKLLYCTYTHQVWGKAARLATLFEHQLVEEDFEEVDESDFELIDGVYYDFRNKPYTYIKTFIIKLHYTNNDQIAIMLNNDEYKMTEMQAWREYATKIAKKFGS